MKVVDESREKYDENKDSNLVLEYTGVRDEDPEIIFKAGQSKRIWNELYKVFILFLLFYFFFYGYCIKCFDFKDILLNTS